MHRAFIILIFSVHNLVEVKTWAAVGSLQVVTSDEGVEESSNQCIICRQKRQF